MHKITSRTILYRIIISAIALVWFVNGFFCKVLDLVPRHREIVSEILGHRHSSVITIGIGLGETILAVGIATQSCRRSVMWLQVLLILTMNILEFFLAPSLLLWGRFNLLFAAVFVAIIVFNELVIRPDNLQKQIHIA